MKDLYHDRIGIHHHHHRDDGRMLIHNDDRTDRHDEHHAIEVDLVDEPCDRYHPGQTFRAEVPDGR